MSRSFRDWNSQRNIRETIEMIMPLFEKKLAFMKEMQERRLTSQEQLEANKVDLEYKKLEATVSDNEANRTLEREKYKAALKNNLDVKTLENQGMLERTKVAGDLEIQKQIKANEGQFAVADMTSKRSLLGQAVAHSGTVQETDPETGKTKVGFNPHAESIARNMSLADGAAGPAPNQVDIDNATLRIMGIADPAQQQRSLESMRMDNPNLYYRVIAQPGPSTTGQPQQAAPGILAAKPMTRQPIAGQATSPSPVSIGSMNTGVVPRRDPFPATGGQPARKKLQVAYDPLGSLSN